MIFDCPKCGRSMKAPESALGRKARCPMCGHMLVVELPEAELIGPTGPAAAKKPIHLPTPAEAANPLKGKKQPTGWYVFVDGGQIGPLAPRDLRRFAKDGKIKPETIVHHTKLAEPMLAGKLPGFQKLFGGEA